jgi:hypothetical protein
MTVTLTQSTTLEAIQQKADEIARFLGAQEAEFLYELNGKAKFEIHLGEMSIGMCFTENGRIVVYALGWPRDRWGKRYYFPDGGRLNLEITVSAKRSSQEIARDIQRRLMPWYTKLFNRCLAKRDKDEQYRPKVYANTRELAGIIGADISKLAEGAPQYELHATPVGKIDPTRLWVKMLVNADYVDIHVNNLTVDQAKRVAAVLKDILGPSQGWGFEK